MNSSSISRFEKLLAGSTIGKQKGFAGILLHCARHQHQHYTTRSSHLSVQIPAEPGFIFHKKSLHLHLLRVFTTSESPPPASSTSESTLVCFPRLTFSERHDKVNPIFAFLVQKWEARLKRPHADPHRLPFFQTKSAKYHLSWTIRIFHPSIWYMKTTFSFLCANLYYLMHLVYYTRFLAALAAIYLHR